ncbi:hypothetical protein ACIP4U_32440 [Streptomyces caelestis]|uniref:hypothetical protein n=1 Tax=Streptomyces caelestis TaxID=36816 RepID=UPI0037F9A139
MPWSAFRERVPAYFYPEKDGPAPLTVPGSGLATPQRMTAYWSGQATCRDGVTQETCRGFRHADAALAATAHIAGPAPGRRPLRRGRGPADGRAHPGR